MLGAEECQKFWAEKFQKLWAKKFRKLFSNSSTFLRSPEFWKECCNSNVHCKFVVDCFECKWYPAAAKEKYRESFSTSKWETLPIDVKKSHSLSEYVYCAVEYLELQKGFLGLPLFEPAPVVHRGRGNICLIVPLL